MFKKVTWATDGSEAADRGLEIARMLTTDSAGELLVVHCIELTLPGKGHGRFPVYANEDELQEKIQRQIEELEAAGVHTEARTTRVPVGEAAHEIAEAALEAQADVIVVGTRGHTALAGLLLGSVAQRLLHVASCPVLAVPTKNSDARR
jgi:nucleotide-binding universal stress UspA family protein